MAGVWLRATLLIRSWGTSHACPRTAAGTNLPGTGHCGGFDRLLDLGRMPNFPTEPIIKQTERLRDAQSE
ncbi:hypothetical protein STRIP9103_06879 [Streptomyces ipomoeae 91-03]|jgi:hypothetical protein|uniref:Uncharacterized protein n=1 Tax=Streptomyces ipomoeae 91-03 TaxID=698759 RepID=L1KZP6_9ACTN|nr:hypothetical protein STRIP9103_06879 [Streptomyces ipomoeae 91-03]